MRNAHAEKKPLAAGSLAESVLDALPHPVLTVAPSATAKPNRTELKNMPIRNRSPA